MKTPTHTRVLWRAPANLPSTAGPARGLAGNPQSPPFSLAPATPPSSAPHYISVLTKTAATPPRSANPRRHHLGNSQPPRRRLLIRSYRQHRRRKVCAAPWRSISHPLPPSLATPRHAAYSAFGAAPARGCGCGGCMLRTRACGPNSRHCKLQTPQSRIAPAPQTCSSNFSARVMIRLHLFSGIGHWLETKTNGAVRKLRDSVQHSRSRRNGGYARPSTSQAAAGGGSGGSSSMTVCHPSTACDTAVADTSACARQADYPRSEMTWYALPPPRQYRKGVLVEGITVRLTY